MADKLLQIGDGTDSDHGIQALISGGTRNLRFNATTGKWEASNDGSTYFDLAGGTPYPSAVNTGTDEDVYRIVPIDLDDPLLVWDESQFRMFIRATSWYNESGIGEPPTHGFLFINNAQDKVVWWDRISNTEFMSFDCLADNAVAASPITVSFLDGKIYVAGNGGVNIIDLMQDTCQLINSAGTYLYDDDIEGRNDTTGHTLVSSGNPIATTVSLAIRALRDPGGSLDAMGRPKHYWAVGTNSGVSVYNPDADAIYDATAVKTEDVAFAQDGSLYWMGSGNGTLECQNNVAKNDADSQGYDAQYSFAVTPYLSGTPSTSTSYDKALSVLSGRSVAEEGANVIVAGLDTVSGGGNARDGINILHENKTTPRESGMVFIANGYQSPYMKGGVNGCWPLQGDADDVGKNDLDLTNNNSVTFDAAGVFGASAANFVAASSMYLSHADDANFNVGSALSLSGWFYREVDSGAGEALFGKWDSAGTNSSYLMYISSGDAIVFYTHDGTTSVTVTGPTVSLNTWYHVVGTYDGATMTLYVNGIKVGTSGSQTGDLNDSTGNFAIGAMYNSSSPTAYFDGRIQNVCVSNAVMNAREIAYDYRRGVAAMGSSAATDDSLEGSSIESVQCDETGGYIAVCAGGSLSILDQFGIPVIVDAASGGTLADACVISTLGGTSPHYAIGTSTEYELVQGLVESRQQKVSSGAFSPRTVVGPVKYLGKHSIKPYDAIIDPAGNGDYRNVNDALDAGAKDIYLREGTHDSFLVDVADVKITGANWDVIVDGTTTAHAIAISAANVTIQNLSAQTTAGGGQSYHGIDITGDNVIVSNCQVLASDNYGIDITSAEVLVQGCLVVGADQHGIYLNGARGRLIGNYVNDCGNADDVYVGDSGDNFLVTGNHCEGTITIHADGEDGNVSGNISDGAVTDNSGTSTAANNEVY